MDDPETHQIYRRERNRCVLGLAAGLTVLVAYAVYLATPGAQEETGPLAWWQTLLVMVASGALITCIVAFSASLVGLVRLLRCRAAMAVHPWQPFDGDVAVPASNQNLHSTFYLDDGSAVLKVVVAFWRERPLLQASTEPDLLWRCGEPGWSQALMVPGHSKLYWARKISVPVLARKTLNDDTGRLRKRP
jgi:hypothetical protein